MKPKPITDEIQAAIEQLKKGYDPAWTQFIDALGPPLYRRLQEFSGGDEEKAQDYLGEVLLLVVRAIGRVKVDNQ